MKSIKETLNEMRARSLSLTEQHRLILALEKTIKQRNFELALTHMEAESAKLQLEYYDVELVTILSNDPA